MSFYSDYLLVNSNAAQLGQLRPALDMTTDSSSPAQASSSLISRLEAASSSLTPSVAVMKLQDARPEGAMSTLTPASYLQVTGTLITVGSSMLGSGWNTSRASLVSLSKWK